MGTPLARLAILISNRVFCTSPLAFACRYKKTEVMPAGIDTAVFKKDRKEGPGGRSILFLGRVSPIKRIEHLIEAAKILDEKEADFALHVVGSPMTGDDVAYERKIKESAEELVKKGKLTFSPKITHSETAKVYNQNELFINLTPTGSFDKTVVEAMACETLVLVSNKSFQNEIPDMFMFEEGNPSDLAEKIEGLFALDPQEKHRLGKTFRGYVEKEHDLNNLVSRIMDEFNKHAFF